VIARAAKYAFSLVVPGLLLAACAGQQAQLPQSGISLPTRIRPAPQGAPELAPPPPGTDEAVILAEYGTPDFVRNEEGSELWRYDGTGCALFFFLYREADNLILRHAETNPSGDGGAIDANCLAGIKQRRAPSS